MTSHGATRPTRLTARVSPIHLVLVAILLLGSRKREGAAR